MRLQVIFLLLLGVAVSSTIADNVNWCMAPNVQILLVDAMSMLAMVKANAGRNNYFVLTPWQKGLVLARFGTAKLVINSVYDGEAEYYWADIANILEGLIESCTVVEKGIQWVTSAVENFDIANELAATITLIRPSRFD